MDDGRRPGAPRRGALINWIGVGLLAGSLAGLEVGAAATGAPSTMLAAIGCNVERCRTVGPALDLAVDGGLAVALVALGAAVLLRRTSSALLLRLLWLTAAASFGLANAVVHSAFIGDDDAPARRDTPALVSLEGVVAADAVDHGRDRRDRSIGRPLLARWAYPPRRTTFPLLVAEHDRSGAPRMRRYDVHAAARAFPIRAGDRLRVRGWLEPDEAPRNPGAFDQLRRRRQIGLAGIVHVPDPALIVRIGDSSSAGGGRSAVAAPPALPAGDRLRAELTRGLLRALGPELDPEVRDLLVTMTLGAGGETVSSVKALFARTGLSHFIVISGFHLAVLAAAMLLVARRAGAGRRTCGVILVVASALFLHVLESQTSIDRAGFAGLVTGSAMILDRGWPAFSVLALVTSAVLFVNPLVAGEASFQLSYAAVAALLVLSRPIEPGLAGAAECLLAPRSWLVHRHGVDIRRIAGRRLRARAEERFRMARRLGYRSALALDAARRDTLPHPDGLRRVVVGRMLARPCAAAVAAWIATTPITLHHFGQMAPWAVAGSFVLAPLASAIAVLGTVTAPLGAATPALAAPLGALLTAAGALLLAAVGFIAELPGASIQAPTQPGWWTATMIALPFVIVAAARGAARLASSRRRRARRACAILAGAMWLALAARPCWPTVPASLEIVSLDLGRGRCVVVRGDAATVMIDGGSPLSAQPGVRTIVPALLAMGIARLDAVVVTERSLASMSGVYEVVRAIPTKRLLAPASLRAATPGSPAIVLLESVAALGIPMSLLAPGETIEIPITAAGDGGVIGRANPATIGTTMDRAGRAADHRVRLLLRCERDDDGREHIACSFDGDIPASALDEALAPRPTTDDLARGARRWRLDPPGGWRSERFTRRGWTPAPPEPPPVSE